ncbi:MAG TPA: AAA family ATPase [Blastocatellia bacterium]|nr:AAA family ATPase [Blastocatellia bacterium]
MYAGFYGLSDLPFRMVPDPRYLFKTESLLEVLANLQYGIESGKGLVVVTGEAGTGKTTTLRVHLRSLDQRVLAAYIFNPLLSTSEFFDTVASEFKVRSEASKSATLRTLGSLLLARHSRGLRTVLVIDEAHLMPPHLLEEIRLLSNFETSREKLLQVVLCGQPELIELLERPQLRQLKQRVSLRCSIQPMTLDETADYIRWRLRVARAKNESVFEPDAIELIYNTSSGIPRIVNNVCDNALLSGFSQGSPTVTARIVSDVIESLGLTRVEVASMNVNPTMEQTEREAADILDSDEPLGPILFEPVPVQPVHFMAAIAAAGSSLHNVRYIGSKIAGYSWPLHDSRARRDQMRSSVEFGDVDAELPSSKFFSRMRVPQR